jgi:hypothetical protein
MMVRAWEWVQRAHQRLVGVEEKLARLERALGRIEARQTAGVAPGDLKAAEFQVSSQWGEDGIIEHLVSHVPVEREIFVEFGVQDYREANTRFLLSHRNWSGLIMDGSEPNIEVVKRDPIYWQHNLKAHCAFITRENINDLITAQGITGDIGLLSVDIDGNDYWVWEAITVVNPRIVVAEYNAIFGAHAAVSVPYAPDFQRTRAHYSNLYWGCSLAALVHLAARRGYALIGCNSAGNNAFFVRKDVIGQLSARTAEQAFTRSCFRESRDAQGGLSYLDARQGLELIGDLPVEDVVSRTVRPLRDVDALARRF